MSDKLYNLDEVDIIQRRLNCLNSQGHSFRILVASAFTGPVFIHPSEAVTDYPVTCLGCDAVAVITYPVLGTESSSSESPHQAT